MCETSVHVQEQALEKKNICQTTITGTEKKNTQKANKHWVHVNTCQIQIGRKNVWHKTTVGEKTQRVQSQTMNIAGENAISAKFGPLSRN